MWGLSYQNLEYTARSDEDECVNEMDPLFEESTKKGDVMTSMNMSTHDDMDPMAARGASVKKVLSVAFLTFLTICMFGGYMANRNTRLGAVAKSALSTSSLIRPDTTFLDLPIEGAAKKLPRPCTFTECYATSCSPSDAPYTCLLKNGGPHGGCSPTPWTPETCDDQCDLTVCASLPIPTSVHSCKGAVCSKEFCSGGQLCGSAASFQCVSGSGRYGCSDDEYHWTFRTLPGVCTECCDTTTCAK